MFVQKRKPHKRAIIEICVWILHCYIITNSPLSTPQHSYHISCRFCFEFHPYFSSAHAFVLLSVRSVPLTDYPNVFACSVSHLGFCLLFLQVLSMKPTLCFRSALCALCLVMHPVLDPCLLACFHYYLYRYAIGPCFDPKPCTVSHMTRNIGFDPGFMH